MEALEPNWAFTVLPMVKSGSKVGDAIENKTREREGEEGGDDKYEKRK